MLEFSSWQRLFFFFYILAISVLTKTIIIWLWRHNKNHWIYCAQTSSSGLLNFERRTLIFQHKKFRFDDWPCDTPINIDQMSCKGICNHCTKQTPDWPWAYQGVCLFEEGMGEWEGGVPCCHSGEFMVSYIQMGRDGSIIAIPMLAKVMDPVNKNDNSYRNSISRIFSLYYVIVISYGNIFLDSIYLMKKLYVVRVLHWGVA